MANPNGASEAVDSPQTPVSHGLFEQVKQTICRLTFGNTVSNHCTHKHHEDVLDDKVQATEGGPVGTPDAIPSSASSVSSIPIDFKTPVRLRSSIPPANFGAVIDGKIYRSAFPAQENFGFLGTLGLKTILTLVKTEVSPEYQHFIEEHNITQHVVPIPPNKGKVAIVSCDMRKALEIVMDPENHPLLIHCNKGKHRTGCVVGCFRKVQEKEFDEITHEYHAYAGSKARAWDEVFVDGFDVNTVLWMARRYQWKVEEEDEITPPPSSSVSTSSWDGPVPTAGPVISLA